MSMYDPMGRLRAQVAQLHRALQPANPIHLQAGAWDALGEMPTAQEIGGRVVARRYDYDKNGNVSAIVDRRFGLTTYQYDVIGRILGAKHQGQDRNTTTELFAFDPAHNMIDTKSANSTAVTNNRVRVWEDKRYEYDSHGNLVTKRVGKHTEIQLEWDVEHQLRVARTCRNSQHYKPLEQTTHYGYDPFGRRLYKRDAFGVTRFLWDGNRLLSETRGSWTRAYLYEPNSFVPLAQVEKDLDLAPMIKDSSSGAKLYYFHKDHLGTPRELTDVDGNVHWAASYKAWGNVLRVEISDVKAESLPVANSRVTPAVALQPLRFQGQYYDVETGLHYNRFRYYDPDCGRFVSLDPIGLDGGVNRYQYGPNPIDWIDPLGLQTRPGGACVHDTGKHGELSPQANRAPGNQNIRDDKFIQSHHPVQNEWAERNIANYDRDAAPAVLLPSASGESHAKISAAQRAWRKGLDALPGKRWGSTTVVEEFNTGYRQMINAGVPKDVAQRAIKKSYKYFDCLGAFR